MNRTNSGLAGVIGPTGPPGPAGTQDLATTLAIGNDTGGTPIVNNPATGPADASIAAYATGGDTATVTQQAFGEVGGADASGIAVATNGGQATANNNATATGGGLADATSLASSDAGLIYFGPIANATRTDLQCNGQTLFKQAAAAPTTFTSLFYRDTTLVTGRMYMWDFVTAAYVPISGVF